MGKEARQVRKVGTRTPLCGSSSSPLGLVLKVDKTNKACDGFESLFFSQLKALLKKHFDLTSEHLRRLAIAKFP
jgi:hypothetical protein